MTEQEARDRQNGKTCKDKRNAAICSAFVAGKIDLTICDYCELYIKPERKEK